MEYKNLEDLKKIVNKYLSEVTTGKVRFNFYLNRKIKTLLEIKSKQTGRPKSDIIRDILERELSK